MRLLVITQNTEVPQQFMYLIARCQIKQEKNSSGPLAARVQPVRSRGSACRCIVAVLTGTNLHAIRVPWLVAGLVNFDANILIFLR